VNLEALYRPIAAELEEVKAELQSLADTFGYEQTNRILEHFFQRPGKFLRPALVLFSAKAVLDPLPSRLRARLVHAAVGVELLHDASLVHDDVIDNDTERRGHPTINQALGNKLAVLTGDVIYSRGFHYFTRALPQHLLLDVVKLNELMCSAEIEQARTLGTDLTRETYYRIIEGKTAAFMSICYHLGSSLAGEGLEDKAHHAIALRRFGLEFGLAYQLFDDRADGEATCSAVDGDAEGHEHLSRAIELLHRLPESPARTELSSLCEFLQQHHKGSKP
jgi:octaprenyl-diphosphate synthase